MRKTLIALIALLPFVASCSTGGGDDPAVLTIYSGREQDLVEDLFEDFTAATGIKVEARYGDSAALAAQILEEGDNTPADVFFAQDGGALGAVDAAGYLAELPDDVLSIVPEAYRAADGSWVGTSGRVRTLVFNTEMVSEDELPASVFDLTEPRWRGAVGWAPANGSFQAFVTAMRVLYGDAATREWLRGMRDNQTVVYPKNTPIVQAVIDGEIAAGLVNHYYLLELKEDQPDAPAENLFFEGQDVGGLINVAGAGILSVSDNQDRALEFIEYMLGTDAQEYFAAATFEYPLVAGILPDPRLPSIEDLDPPIIDLSDLSDLQATLEMMADENIL